MRPETRHNAAASPSASLFLAVLPRPRSTAFGTTLSNSDVARSDLLRYVDYPDSVSGSDRVAMTYNRQGQMTTRTDQRGVVRSFSFDKLGRLTDDYVSTLSTADGTIRKISRTYEVRGMVETITSYDNSNVAKNQVKLEYNEFGQLKKESQDHSSTVGLSTPNVQYAYDAGGSSSNEIRPTSLTYPNGRVISYDYGSATADDRLSRVTNIKDGATALAGYTSLGAGTVIRIDYSQPGVRLDLWGGTSGAFAGIDLFGRVVDQRWVTTGVTPSDRDRYKYGYDRNSNRQWRQNTVGSTLDEYYTYDNLNRLTVMQRGTLTGSPPTGISGTPVAEQDWTLDPTGNWNGFITKASGSTSLNQSRTQNTVNEITAISASVGTTWATPAYDAAGNMTSMPQPVSLASSYTAVYDAWNRMVQIKSGVTVVATYSYDGRNRRIKVDTGVVRHFYFTDSWQDVEERLGSLTTADRQYVWGIRYIDELVCRDRVGGSSSSSSSSGGSGLNERLYAMQDANFNVTGLIDTSGAVIERYTYDPYGKPTFRNSGWTVIGASSVASTILYGGYKYDQETQLYCVRNRYLHSGIGFWASRDPIEGDNITALYQYVRGNPCDLIDPYGLSSSSAQQSSQQQRSACAAPPTPPEKCCTITTVIELPDPKAKDALQRLGLSGHAGIGIGNDYYDFGPQPGQGRNLSGSQGRPWWDSQIPGIADASLSDIFKNIAQLGDPNQPVYTIKIEVSQAECDKAKAYWDALYKNPPKYFWYGLNCSTTVCQSLIDAGIITIKDNDVVGNPTSLLNKLKRDAVNTCGPNKGKAGTVTKLR